MGKDLPQKGKIRENNSLFSRIFPFFGKYSPILTTSLRPMKINSITLSGNEMNLGKLEFKVMWSKGFDVVVI